MLQAYRASQNGTTAKVVILGNFKQCRWALDELKNGGDAELKKITTVESMGIKSSTTQEWEKLVRNIVPKGTANEDLLLTSLYRYFMLEDYMAYNNITGHVLQLDADTMLYSDPATFGTSLRKGYPRLGLAPSIHRRFLSASTMYIGSRSALRKMNAFFAYVASNKTGVVSGGGNLGMNNPLEATSSTAPVQTGLQQYASWLRSFACCKAVSQGGLLSLNGVEGVRPWAVNDMTLLAFYRLKLGHREVGLFPLLPQSVINATNSIKSGSGSSGEAGVDAPTVALALTNSSVAAAAGYLSGELPASGDHHHLPANAVQMYAEGGVEAGPSLNVGLFDTSSGWGAHLASIVSSATATETATATATSTIPVYASAASSSPRATDRHAVVEQAVLRFGCKVSFHCSRSCVTVPEVVCGTGPKAQLLTLHMNPKNREKISDFISVRCSCNDK